MATNPEFARRSSAPGRLLTEDVIDALREVVLVVDAGGVDLPLIMANYAARRSFLGEDQAISMVDASLYSLLAPGTESLVSAALETLRGGQSSVSRILPWRFPRGEFALSSVLTMLPSSDEHPIVMVTLTDPSNGPVLEQGLLSAIGQLPLDLLILDTALKVTYANAGGARTASRTAEGMVGLSALLLAPTSAVPRDALNAALRGRHFHEVVALAVPGATTRWLEVDIQPLRDHTEITGLVVLSTDVTERRGLRRAASGGEKRLAALTAHARDIILVAAPDGQIQYVSGGIFNVLGYSAENRLSHSLFDQVHPDERDEFQEKYTELAMGQIARFSRQLRFRHKDGSYRWLELTLAPAMDDPLIRGVVVNARDITERKQAEARLAQREEVFQLASDAVNGIIFEWDLRDGIVHRSHGVRDVLGMEPRDLEAAGAWAERIHPHDAKGYADKTATALANGRGWTASYRIRNRQGRYRSILERALIQRSAGGEPIRAIGCAVDVSEIKRLSDLLEEAQRVAQMGGWEYSYTTGELEWTEEMFHLYGTAVGKFDVSWASMIERCLPASQQRLNEALARAESTDATLDLELEITTLKGEHLWVRVLGHIEKLDGRPFRAFGCVQNIQSQKLAQIAFENSTDWLKLSMSMAHMHAWRWNRATDTLEFAIPDGQMVHLPRVFPGMKQLLSRVHPKDRVELRRAIDHAFEWHAEVQKEYRLRSHDGRYRAYASVARPLFDAANQPCGLVGVTQDVTARHDSEARLRRSEELLRTTTANTADTLLLVDTGLSIRFMNRDAWGLGINEIVGSDIRVLLPPSARESVVEKLRQVLLTGETSTYEFERNTGADTEYFENRAVLVRDGGIDTGISITMRNITERKRMEREILDVSSRERQAIGRDLHDGLGQELTGVALMLRGLATRIAARCPDSMSQVEEIVGLVNQSIDTARSLARGLMPIHAGSGGLAGALRSIAERSRDMYGLHVDCEVSAESSRALSDTTANHLYRIVQEALTNIARHARASSVSVCLVVTPQKFILRVADDGIGMDGSSSETPGMGLKIMQYRAGMIGATFEMLPNQPRGTVITVTGRQTAVADALESVCA